MGAAGRASEEGGEHDDDDEASEKHKEASRHQPSC